MDRDVLFFLLKAETRKKPILAVLSLLGTRMLCRKRPEGERMDEGEIEDGICIV
jgi:hypothetical protein